VVMEAVAIHHAEVSAHVRKLRAARRPPRQVEASVEGVAEDAVLVLPSGVMRRTAETSGSGARCSTPSCIRTRPILRSSHERLASGGILRGRGRPPLHCVSAHDDSSEKDQHQREPFV
jgi:hypothetical protein